MRDEERPREQLLEELVSLRLQLASLENPGVEQKRVEGALCFSEANCRLSLNDIPLAAWVYDNETWRFLMVNQAAIDRYGYSREEFLSMTLRDIRPQEDVVELEKVLKTSSERRRLTGNWRHRKKDGSLIWVAFHSVELEGHMARLVVNEDITERFRAEAELRKSEAKTRP